MNPPESLHFFQSIVTTSSQQEVKVGMFEELREPSPDAPLI